jgi:thiamine transporter
MFTKQDGYYEITTAGYIVFALIALIAVVAVGMFFQSKKETSKKFNVKTLVFSAIALSIAYVLSYIQPYKLPWGGSVTLFSMLFITLIGYWYGLKAGLTVALAYSILQFIQSGGSYILTPFQVCCDYFFAFTALGLSGLFKGKKNGLLIGYIVAIAVRGLFHTVGGYLYWMEYMPEDFPKALAWAYPIIYNYAYIVIEGVATVILISIPPVKKALAQVKQMATEA